MRQVNPKYNVCSVTYHRKTVALNDMQDASVTLSEDEKNRNVIILCWCSSLSSHRTFSSPRALTLAWYSCVPASSDALPVSPLLACLSVCLCVLVP
ncbi:hypothetical protein E2C01_041235 [Portunus trituberculatus]|uniref:Uncharacterized protein n=1 Tax=Portunus trituberculatus TaxID=210409 RepID=A0A5B7FPV4_PORTR|nr:hypothetical protein [Portunus trituberculatus]